MNVHVKVCEIGMVRAEEVRRPGSERYGMAIPKRHLR